MSPSAQKTATTESVALLLNRLRLDPSQSHLLLDGVSLARQAATEGIADFSNLGHFLRIIVEMRQDELLRWDYYLGPLNIDLMTDQEFMNCHNFRLTAKGQTLAREIATVNLAGLLSCSEILSALGWKSVVNELQAADEQHAQGHWPDAIREYARSLESAIKYALPLTMAKPQIGLAAVVKQATEANLIPSDYRPLFDVVRQVRNTQSHGQGPNAQQSDPGPTDSLLMANLVRTLILYLGHRTHPGPTLSSSRTSLT